MNQIIQIIPAPAGYFARLENPGGGICDECRVICLALVEDTKGKRKVVPMRGDEDGAELSFIGPEPCEDEWKWELFFM